MAGVVIASAVVEGEGMSVAVETPVDVAHRWCARAAVAGPTLQQRMVARPVVAPIPQQRVAAALTVAVADRVVAANAASWCRSPALATTSLDGQGELDEVSPAYAITCNHYPQGAGGRIPSCGDSAGHPALHAVATESDLHGDRT